MAKDARQCIVSAANSAPHWESAQEWIDSLIQSYWSQVAWHEFGHSQGLTHNFMGSVDKSNFPVVARREQARSVLDTNGEPQRTSSTRRPSWSTTRRPIASSGGPDGGLTTMGAAHAGSMRTTALTPPSIAGNAGSSASPVSSPASAPWNDPNGFQADGKTEIQYLLCNETHEKYTPLCRKNDMGVTPSEITANDLDNYEWQYAWRNFRTYHKVWDDSNYADQPLDFVTEQRRFISLWNYDMSSSEVTQQMVRLGVTPPPDAPSAQLYYQQLTNKFNNELSGAASMMAAFHEAIVQQSSGQRPYITQYDNYFGDVTLQGITLDKLDAVQSFLSLWPVDNYDQTQAAGAVHPRPSRARRSATSPPRPDSGVGSLYQTVAEDAVMAMVGGRVQQPSRTSAPLGVAMFTQDTQSEELHASGTPSPGARQTRRDWTGGWAFTRTPGLPRVLPEHRSPERLVSLPRVGINCYRHDGRLPGLRTASPCTIPAHAAGVPERPLSTRRTRTSSSGRTAGVTHLDLHPGAATQWVVCDQDRNVATYQVFLAYTVDVIQCARRRQPGAATRPDRPARNAYELLHELRLEYYRGLLPRCSTTSTCRRRSVPAVIASG